METRIVEAIVAGPKTALELRDIAGCSSPEVLRNHLTRIRQKLPCGGILSEARYVLTREARHGKPSTPPSATPNSNHGARDGEDHRRRRT